MDGDRRNMAENFVPLEMLGCTSLRQLSFIGCKGLVVSPVIGELMSLQVMMPLLETCSGFHAPLERVQG